MQRGFVPIIVLALALSAIAQEAPRPSAKAPQTPAKTQTKPPAQKKKESANAITGRVVGENGQALGEASVMLLPANLGDNESRSAAAMLRPITTEADGRFDIPNLEPGSYSLTAILPGYVARSSRESAYYRPGDYVTITMVKGGVITGRVTNFAGEAVVGVRVKATRIRDTDNRAVRVGASNTTAYGAIGMVFGSLLNDWQTDDRGIYRIYGLEPGTYHVSAGGKGFVFFSMGGYDRDAPTYHPSGTVDTAADVSVRAGEEAAGIDIRYRDNRGYAVSGAIIGANEVKTDAVIILLTRASTGNIESTSFVFPNSPERGFLLNSVPDGEYYIAAMAGGESRDSAGSASPPRRVTVRGADVTGIELTLALLGSVSGQVVLERAVELANRPECKPARPSTLQEIILQTKADKSERPKDEPDSLFAVYGDASPDEKGQFKIRLVEAGQKYLAIKLPGEDWFVRSIILPPPTPGGKPLNAGKDGFKLKPGEQVTGLRVIISDGAATFAGKVIIPKEEETLPARLRVHLVPAEKEAADDTLRYGETLVKGDGLFKFTNVAPGKYWVVFRPLPDDESLETETKPVAWDAGGRTGLRFEGEAAGLTIEIKACDRIQNHELKYMPPMKVSKPTPKKPL